MGEQNLFEFSFCDTQMVIVEYFLYMAPYGNLIKFYIFFIYMLNIQFCFILKSLGFNTKDIIDL